MELRLGPAAWALLALTLFACVKPNPYGSRPRLDGSPEAASDTAPPTTPDSATVDQGSVAAPPDAAPALTPDAGTDQAPDQTTTECTPRQLDCTADNKATRLCDERGRWTTGTTCGPQTTCSAGLCLCTPETCDEGPIHEVPGLVETLAGSGRTLFMATIGLRASIRRFDVQLEQEQTVHMGGSDFTRFALDADPMGNLVWCSDVRSGAASSGQLTYGTTTLDPNPCVHVRKVGDLIYYRDPAALQRRATDGSARQTVSSEPMTRFELAGDHLYFIGAAGEEAFLKRFALAEPGKIETLLRRPAAIFRQLAVDGSHVYVVSDDRLLRVPVAGNAEPEDVWLNEGPEAWAVALSESHVYWSTTTFDLTGNGCLRAQVWRRPKKAGGARVAISTVPGQCAGELLILEGRLYTPISTQGLLSGGPSQVLRIRL
jgi:hypothetical protein